MEFTEIRDNLCLAIDIFMSKDKKLLYVGVNERTITHKIAEYLQILFDGYNVDCEYNRHGKKVKQSPICIDRNNFYGNNVFKNFFTKEQIDEIIKIDTNISNIIPDIVVHSRINDDNNLLIIEAKKKIKDSIDNTYLTNLKKDFEKLSELTKENSEYRYQYGAFIFIDDINNKIDNKIIWFKNGESIE